MNKKNQDTVLGVIVKSRLKDFNMTQAELADKVGTSNVYLNYILSGKRGGKKYIQNIYEVLNIDIAYISKFISKIYVHESDIL